MKHETFDLHSNAEDEEGILEQRSSYDLWDVDFTAAVKITHSRVEDALQHRISTMGPQLKFFSDWTGRGKTSGVILATGKLFQRGQAARVLFITREIAGVDDVTRHFLETWPDLDVVGYSSAHRKYDTKAVDWEVYRDDVDPKELKTAQIVVTTHEYAKGWVGNNHWPAGKDFDLVVVDEYPDPVKADTVPMQDITTMRSDCYNKNRLVVLAEVEDWANKVYNEGFAPKPTWLDKIDSSYPERLVKLVEAIKAGRLFATKDNRGWTTLQWAELMVPFEQKAIIFSATNHVEGWQFDPNVTDKITYNLTEQPTNYEDLTITFTDWPKDVPTNNKTLGEHVEASLKAIEQQVASLPNDGKDMLILAPKPLCDGIPKGWLDQMGELRGGGKVYLNNWGKGIGSNAYKDCHHMIIFGLYHKNKNGHKEHIMGHGRFQSEGSIEVGSFEDKAMQTAKKNHHTRWIVQMLNRISVRTMVSGDRDLDMYKAQAGNIIWITAPKDRSIAEAC
mgnify:CR=1 FL=1